MTAVQSFIAGGTIEPEICDGVLDFYNTCEYLEKVAGETSQGVDKIIKQSTDMAVPSWLKDHVLSNILMQFKVEYLYTSNSILGLRWQT